MVCYHVGIAADSDPFRFFVDSIRWLCYRYESTFGWKWIVPMRIFVSNLAIHPMNNQLRFLIPGDAMSNSNSLRLGLCTSGSTYISFTFDLPASIGVGSDMLIFTF